jgi:hypothetical protein
MRSKMETARDIRAVGQFAEWRKHGESDGRHDWIRTNDLYRVKVAL